MAFQYVLVKNSGRGRGYLPTIMPEASENYTLKEGDILYLTKNSKINFARDIAPLFSSAYMVSEIKDNN